MSQANVSLIQSLYAAFGRGEIATIIAALTPDMEWRLNGSRSDHPLLGTCRVAPRLAGCAPPPGVG